MASAVTRQQQHPQSHHHHSPQQRRAQAPSQTQSPVQAAGLGNGMYVDTTPF
jgi:hypothetical protein